MKIIKENSLWSNEKEAEDFFKSPTNLGDAFWINILGFSALYDIDKKFPQLQRYFRSVTKDDKQSDNIDSDIGDIDDIDDSSIDLMLTIKLLNDQDLLRTIVVRELHRYLIRLKMRKAEKIDQNELRNILKKIPFAKVKTSSKIRPIISDFINGKSELNDILDPLFKYCWKLGICKEFIRIAKRMRNVKDNEVVENKRVSFKDYLKG